ncbi:MAG TPA: flagellar basal-body MS-ring/collar protein FliF [Bacillales bacterium]|nr:flagellar basal-body MS-ring/collar protein FliF [Bacillales bacterium]
MKEALLQYKDKGAQLWRKQTRLKKRIFIGSFALLVVLILFVVMASKPSYVPLYSNLSPQETGQIKQTLDAKWIPSKILHNGTTISVPESQVDALKVELAAEGIPKSGHIDYTFFSENAGWGMTSQELAVVKQEAMQTELSRLIASVNGVQAANVMISLPEKSVWVSDQKQSASASVVLDLKPGYQVKPEQVQALYHLISKSVPNLPVDNIVIMDEMFNYFEPVTGNAANSVLSAYEEQHEIKQSIEQNLQQRIQRMLGMMVGRDKVMVSVTTSIDFTKEKSVKKLVEPVDKENMEGLRISVERIRETYSGDGSPPGGVVGTGAEDVPGYNADADRGNGQYERVEERINNAVNHIRKEIVKSPYTIRDMGIQVMLEPPEPNNPGSLPEGRINDIENILATVIRTTLPKDGGQNITNQEIDDKISISVQPFNGRVDVKPNPEPAFPYWYYIVAGLLLLIMIMFLFLLLRKKRVVREEGTVDVPDRQPEVSDVNDEQQNKEETARRKQLEQMAKDRPEEFAKLLRSWLSGN